MLDPQQVAEQLVETFDHIHTENMQGIPILNPNIGIEALGFQEIDGRILGVIICPWLMNVVLLPMWWSATVVSPVSRVLIVSGRPALKLVFDLCYVVLPIAALLAFDVLLLWLGLTRFRAKAVS